MFYLTRDVDIDVARLLVSADLLKPAQLDKALASCRDGVSSLNTVLVDEGLVERRVLQAAFEVSEGIRSGRVPWSQARTALYLMGNCEMSLEEVSARLGFWTASNPWHARLMALASEDRW
jgi:hypothetical protein